MKDYRYYADKRERQAQRAAQDSYLRDLSRSLDRSAQDVHMKYERPSFIVVTASEAFRRGWENIQWQ